MISLILMNSTETTAPNNSYASNTEQMDLFQQNYNKEIKKLVYHSQPLKEANADIFADRKWDKIK